MNESDLFRQATKIICGSLDVQLVLERCLSFLGGVIPLDGLNLNVFDPQARSIISIADAGEQALPSQEFPVPEEAVKLIEASFEQAVDLVNHPKDDLLARILWEHLGNKEVSTLVLKLIIDEHRLGVVVCTAKGLGRYTQEHARLLALLHDPFAIAMSNALRHQEVLRLKDLLADDNQYLNRQLHLISGDEIVGSEYGLRPVMDMVQQIAPRSSQVLLLGETGVGKEVIANAIHYSSARSRGPFIKVNCGAIPESLIDSELFGHEKGAFTGALAMKRGRFERAHRGTLFLDEIGELPPSVQVRLLRVLQNKEIERVGGTKSLPVDVRIITATHCDLPQMVRDGTFREDLWFRLNVFPITIPPLRQRKSDILALTRFFMEKKARELNFREQPVLARGALERLQSYNWPGNVRELENLVERTIIQTMTRTPGKPLEFETLITDNDPKWELPDNADNLDPGPLLLDEVTAQHIRRVLKITGGRVQGAGGAADLLGINPNTLRNRMKKLGVAYGRRR